LSYPDRPGREQLHHCVIQMKLVAILFPLWFSSSSKMGPKLSCTVSPSPSSSSSSESQSAVHDEADVDTDCDLQDGDDEGVTATAASMDGVKSQSAHTINLLLIRHGRSWGNEMMDQPGNQWGDPNFRDDENLIDAHLSSRGVEQAIALGRSLSQRDLDRIELVVVSPLTRALQTMQLAILPRLPLHVPIIVHPWSAERVYTASDTGRPVSQLKLEFQDSRINFDCCMPNDQKEDEDERWWFHTETSNPHVDEWRPCDAYQWYAVPGEPQDVFDTRLKQFEDWLSKRQEQNICLVSHWAVLRHLTGGYDFENCEAQWIAWQRNANPNECLSSTSSTNDDHW